jgi:hypothetical protein
LRGASPRQRVESLRPRDRRRQGYRWGSDGPHAAGAEATPYRRPSLESQVRQLLKAAQVAGVQIAVTIEGDKVTATPVRGSSPANREDPTDGSPRADAAPGRALFKARAVPKVKVVL